MLYNPLVQTGEMGIVNLKYIHEFRPKFIQQGDFWKKSSHREIDKYKIQ